MLKAECNSIPDDAKLVHRGIGARLDVAYLVKMLTLGAGLGAHCHLLLGHGWHLQQPALPAGLLLPCHLPLLHPPSCVPRPALIPSMC